MNYQRPELRNKLAAEYVLGTLKGGARKIFERLLQDDRELRALVEVWTGRLVPIGLPREDAGPSKRVWVELERKLEQSATTVAHKQSSPRWFQRFLPGGVVGGSLAGAIGGIALGVISMLLIAPEPSLVDTGTTLRSGNGKGVVLVAQPSAPTEGQLPDSFIGVLLDDSGTPVVIATAPRTDRVLNIKVLQRFSIGPEKVPVLWALSQTGNPTLIGHLPAEGAQALTLPAPSEQVLRSASQLAVSIDDRVAQSYGAPRTSFVVRGHLVKTW